MGGYLTLSEDGQPDEAKEWEDYEGPQDIYKDDWSVFKIKIEEYRKARRRKQKK